MAAIALLAAASLSIRSFTTGGTDSHLKASWKTFKADADLRDPIVSGVKRREPMIDFKTANEAQLEGAPDLEVLAKAADEGRMLVPHDVNTMPEHFTEFIKTRTSPGVVLINQDLPYSEAIDGLIRLWATAETEYWENVISFLPH